MDLFKMCFDRNFKRKQLKKNKLCNVLLCALEYRYENHTCLRMKKTVEKKVIQTMTVKVTLSWDMRLSC